MNQNPALYIYPNHANYNWNVFHGQMAVLCAPLHASEQILIPLCPLPASQASRTLCHWGPLSSPSRSSLARHAGWCHSFLVPGMTARTSVLFFCSAVVKTADDHCGLWLPGNIFHIFFQNNTAYHDIHHQLPRAKYNYSQPFFSIWDKLLGTHMPCTLVNRPEGGLEARLVKG